MEMTGQAHYYRLLCRLIASENPPDIDLAGINWNTLTQIAEREGVSTLLAWHIQKESFLHDQVPAINQQGIQKSLFSRTAQSLQIDRTIHDLAVIASRANIPLLFLKGAYTRTLYPSQTLRSMSDLDLLVPEAYLHAAVKAFEENGYDNLEKQKNYEAIKAAVDYHWHLRKNQPDSIPFELHYRLIGSKGDWREPPIGWFWEQVVPLSTQKNVPALTLSPTAQLLHLAAHLFYHHGKDPALKWFYDIHLLLTQCNEQIDWEAAVSRAGEFHWALPLAHSLAGCAERFNTVIPNKEELLARLEALGDAQSQWHMANPRDPDDPQAKRIMRKARTMPLHLGIAYAFSAIAPDPTFMRQRYGITNPWQVPFYYLYRWVSIVGRLIRTMFRKLHLG